MDTGERCGARLKAMEKIDEGKDKKHTGKRTDNPEDGTPYITCQSGMRRCSIRVSQAVK